MSIAISDAIGFPSSILTSSALAGFNVSEQATTVELDRFHFVFEEAPSTDRSASALRVVGIHAYIYNVPANFDALVNHASIHPTIRALVLLFDSSDRLQEFVKPFVEVLTLTTQAETIELVLAYEEGRENKAVGVDLVTLKPNGASFVSLFPLSRY